MPPTRPMMRENAMAFQEMSRVRANWKASSEKVWKFTVEIVKSCMKDAKNRPARPPASPSISDSIRNAERMLILLKPSARMVPISPILLATAAYMVIIAPMMAPREKMEVSERPRMRRNFAIISDWSK